MNELGIKPNRFTKPPLEDHSLLYGINFSTMKMHAMTRSNKPRRKLNFDQVAMLLITPVEAHEELIRSM